MVLFSIRNAVFTKSFISQRIKQFFSVLIWIAIVDHNIKNILLKQYLTTWIHNVFDHYRHIFTRHAKNKKLLCMHEIFFNLTSAIISKINSYKI